jgi:hypothetical protein
MLQRGENLLKKILENAATDFCFSATRTARLSTTAVK